MLYLPPCSVSTRFQVMAYSYGVSRSHSLDTPHSVGLLWTSDQAFAETSAPHDTQNGQPSIPPVEFETTIAASERRQSHVLDRAATGFVQPKYLG